MVNPAPPLIIDREERIAQMRELLRDAQERVQEDPSDEPARKTYVRLSIELAFLTRQWSMRS